MWGGVGAATRLVEDDHGVCVCASSPFSPFSLTVALPPTLPPSVSMCVCARVGVSSVPSLGELQCLGVSGALKRRFGIGYMFTVTHDPASNTNEADLPAFVTSLFPSARLLSTPIAGKYKYSRVDDARADGDLYHCELGRHHRIMHT